ncbi:hypothetical protein MMC14_000355 [Varicellaria rhodocarpa]|nr:hypothetical protein [Varicellaria rhodocarpa]
MAYTSLSSALIAVSVVFPVLAVLCVALRLYVRSRPKWRLLAADYLVMVALIIAIANCITNIAGVVIGGIGNGLGFEELSLPQITSQTKVLFAFQFFLLFSIGLVKISIILFYKQIFVTPKFKLAADILIGIIIAWIIAFFFTTLFQTWPISTNWTGMGRNILNEGAMYTAQAVLDIALDIAVLAMPLPMIRKLQLSTKRKWNLVGIFWLGAFCVVSSVLRLYYNIQYNNLENNAENDQNFYSSVVVNTLIWSTIEPCTSIIAACLPTYGPLYRDGSSFKSFVYGLRSLTRSRGTQGPNGSISLADRSSGERNGSHEMKTKVYTESVHKSSEADVEAYPRHLV